MIIGATGLVGRHLVAVLKAAGAKVILVRRGAWGEESADVPTRLSANLQEPEEIRRMAVHAVALGCRAVVLAVHPTLGAAFAEALAAQCGLSGADEGSPAVVAFSSTRVLSRVDIDGSPAAVRAAEARLLACGLRGVVLRPTMIHGIGDRSLSRLAAWGRRGVVLLPGGGRVRVAPVHAWDVARAVALALVQPWPCDEAMQVVTLSGEASTLAHIIGLQAVVEGRRPPWVLGVPRWPGVPLKLLARVVRGGRIVSLAASYGRAFEDRAPGHDDASRLLGWEPMPPNVALRLTAAESRQVGLGAAIARAVSGADRLWWEHLPAI